MILKILKSNNNKLVTYLHWLSIFIAGALLPFAFAPYHIWPLAILSPAYLLWVWLNSHQGIAFRINKKSVFFSGDINQTTEKQKQNLRLGKQVFLEGFIYGLGMFGIGVSWVFVSIHHFGNTEAPVAALLTAVMISLLALLFGCQGYLLNHFFKGSRTAYCLLGFPCSWILFEWFRSVYFTGFPWLFLGYSQFNTVLSGFAPIGSVYAVSFSVVLCSGACVLLFSSFSKYNSTRDKHNIKAYKINYLFTLCLVSLIVSLWGGAYFLQRYDWTSPFTHGIDNTVSLVQGNVSPLDKFIQEDPIQAARNTYLALSEPYWKSDLIIWPENAIAYPLPMAQSFLNELNSIAEVNQTTLITGVQTMTSNHDYYNSMIALGKGSGLYHKRHLVPFGDYLPLENTLRGLINFFDIPMSNFIEGPKAQPLLKAGNLNIAPLICYEIAFPELVRETTQQANVIITVSEDGWFGDSLGPHQHLDIARMRAIETGRPLLRATTSGISAIINHRGEFQAISPQFKSLVLTGTFQAKTGETPWMRFGIMPILILAFLGFVCPGRIMKRSKSFLGLENLQKST